MRAPFRRARCETHPLDSADSVSSNSLLITGLPVCVAHPTFSLFVKRSGRRSVERLLSSIRPSRHIIGRLSIRAFREGRRGEDGETAGRGEKTEPV